MEETNDRPPLVFSITEEWPTPILRDFELFTKALEAPTAHLTKSRQNLNRKTLFRLNQEMKTFRSEAHERTNQEFYLLLHMFQRICMNRFHDIKLEKGKLRLIPNENLEAFRSFSPAEKFIALLEVLWMDCDWEDLFSAFGFFHTFDSYKCLELLCQLPSGQEVIFLESGDVPTVKPRIAASISIFPSAMIRLFSFFGLVTYTVDDSPEMKIFGRSADFVLRSITVTEFGSCILRILEEERPLELWNDYSPTSAGIIRALELLMEDENGYELVDEKGEAFEELPQVEYEDFYEAFSPILAKGSLTKGLPAGLPEPVEGTYVFKVSWQQDVWRTIALSARHSLHDLHLTILEAFAFDYEHYYGFFMDGRAWSKNALYDPGMDEGPWADGAELGQLRLYQGKKILYIYDFGDSWRFDVTLEKILEEPWDGPPEILKTKGESPEQYPYEEEW